VNDGTRSRPDNHSVAPDGDSTGPDGGSTGPDDPLAPLRAQLATIDDLPLEERVARFEQINASIAAQLAELDEL
jgi:hypothetical protein